MVSATEKSVILQRWYSLLPANASKRAVLNSDGRVVRTFRQVDDDARQWEEKLAVAEPGEIIALKLGNRAEWPAILIGCLRRGLVPLPLGQMPAHERERVLSSLNVPWLLNIDENEQLCLSKRETDPASRRSPSEGTNALKLTSGTTGAARAIEFTAEQLVADCDNVCETMGIKSSDLNFGVIPLSHSYGFSNLVTPLICRAVPAVISAERMPRAILEGLVQSRATVFPGMPVFFQALVELAGEASTLPDLRLCISAGAPLSPRLAQQFDARFNRRIHTFYGSSECGGIAYDREGDVNFEAGFIGTPMENVSVKVREDGRIEVLSSAVGTGYFPEADPESLGDGRFSPGDLISATPNGLRIIGRLSDIINVAGRKLNPAEVEAEFSECEGVSAVVVFGVPSSIRGEEAVACVTGTVTAEALARFAAERLSPWKTPKDYWIVPSLTTNERGKISRAELARQYAIARATHKHHQL